MSKSHGGVASEGILRGLEYESCSVTSTEIEEAAQVAVEVKAFPAPILLLK
jgi:hypothetical protein